MATHPSHGNSSKTSTHTSHGNSSMTFTHTSHGNSSKTFTHTSHGNSSMTFTHTSHGNSFISSAELYSYTEEVEFHLNREQYDDCMKSFGKCNLRINYIDKVSAIIDISYWLFSDNLGLYRM